MKDERVYLCIVCNSAPWTFIGNHPVNANPLASFDSGLDLLALRSLGTVTMMRTLAQMLAARAVPLHGHAVVSGHDLAEITLQADRPLALQLDGEYMGEVEGARFRSVPRALRVVGLGELN
jgi:diacylglycerol kinase family enzyme